MLVLIFFISLLVSITASETFLKEYELYSLALEKIVANDIPGAMKLLNQLLAEYPDTSLKEKAQMYLAMYSNKVDHSGIIGFYTGWLATSVFVTNIMPLLFDISDPLVLSGTSIAGIGTGLWIAWAMSNKQPMSLGQDIWIEFMEVASLTNMSLGYWLCMSMIEANMDFEYILKIWGGLSIATSLASRLVTYYMVKDLMPSPDRIALISQSYLWAHAYYWPIMMGIVKCTDMDLDLALGIAIPDAAAVAAGLLWDGLGWSYNRIGLITVGGLAGSLIGGALNLGIASLVPDFPIEGYISVTLGCTLAGKIVTVLVTENMDTETIKTATLPQGVNFTLAPLFSADGFGLQGQVSF